MSLKQPIALIDIRALLAALLVGLFAAMGSLVVFVYRASVYHELSKDAEKDYRALVEILGKSEQLDESLRERDKNANDLLNKIRENRTAAAENAGAIEALARDKANEVAKALASNKEFVRSTAEHVEAAHSQRLPQAWVYFSARDGILKAYNVREVKAVGGPLPENMTFEVVFDGEFIDPNYIALVSSVPGPRGVLDGSAIIGLVTEIKKGSIQVVFPYQDQSFQRFYLIAFGEFKKGARENGAKRE
ncbi:MAG: hypothetical protein WA746_10825 [Isosphaeraceae bacterium]